MSSIYETIMKARDKMMQDKMLRVAGFIMRPATYNKLRFELEGCGQMYKMANGLSVFDCLQLQGIPIHVSDIIPWSWVAMAQDGTPLIAGELVKDPP